jgi:hypothetical protein
VLVRLAIISAPDSKKIEGDNKELTSFVRVDSDHIDNLIKKEWKISFLNYLMKSRRQ